MPLAVHVNAVGIRPVAAEAELHDFGPEYLELEEGSSIHDPEEHH